MKINYCLKGINNFYSNYQFYKRGKFIDDYCKENDSKIQFLLENKKELENQIAEKNVKLATSSELIDNMKKISTKYGLEINDLETLFQNIKRIEDELVVFTCLKFLFILDEIFGNDQATTRN